MSTERIEVEPSVLLWARNALSLDTATAAQKLGVSLETLDKWESGVLYPTIKQLRKAARVYRVSLAVLLLPGPPTSFQPIRDYRRLSDGSTPSVSYELHTELRRADMQREVFLEFSILAPDAVVETNQTPLLHLDMETEDAGQQLRDYLGVSLATQERWRDANTALNGWIDAVEAQGIIVIQTARVSIAEARGFSVSEFPFPVIGLNGSDWPRPRVFTLFHELAHIALNLGGLCDLHETSQASAKSADRLETFCNAVAAAAIMPANDILSLSIVQHSSRESDWTTNELDSLASKYKISTEALLLRLISLQKASWDLYWRRKSELENIYAEARAQQQEIQKESDGGPPYYRIKARNIGHGYAHAVLDAYRSRAISSLDVADYLQVKFNQIPKLESVLR